MKTKKAFTLIELLVVIAIIGILATIAVISLSNARAKARDAKRVGNAKQIQTALELFYNDNGRYPSLSEFSSGSIQTTTSEGLVTYMMRVPSSPVPADGPCDDSTNPYIYTVSSDGSTYTMSYCIGGRTGGLSSGPKCLTRDGVLDVSCGGGSVVVPPAFVCGVDSVTYEGGPYNTVQIGTQCWLGKNLNVGTMINEGFGSAQTNNGIIEKYCSSNTLGNCVSDGGLYQWAEAIVYLNGATNTSNWSSAPVGNVQGLCPSGWHIPSDTEWYTLSNFLTNNGHLDNEGAALKAAPSAWNGTDDYGFAALPAGDFSGGSDHFRGQASSFWTSSISSSNSAFLRHLFTNDHQDIKSTLIDRDDMSRISAYSIRCLQD